MRTQEVDELKEKIVNLGDQRKTLLDQRKMLENEESSLRAEIADVQKSLNRAMKLRTACQRLTSLDKKLVKDTSGKGSAGKFEKISWFGVLGVGLLAILAGVALLADRNVQRQIQKYCTPSMRSQSRKNPELDFHPLRPPLLKDGVRKNESKTVLWGAAALHVCSRGTSEVSFLRRDDCDGCLCPTGSVWVHYKDPRFFGNGAFCVPEQEWKTCISKWSCCAYKPNLCWDFIFDGARHDPNKTASTVLVDTCSQHMSCYVLIKRFRKWVLVSEHVSAREELAMTPLEVGVDPAAIAKVNQTLKMVEDTRGWGMPSSVLHLIKVTVSTAPQEWKATQQIDVERSFRAGASNRIWQLVSSYRIVAKGMAGDEHVLAAWDQREWNSFHDAE